MHACWYSCVLFPHGKYVLAAISCKKQVGTDFSSGPLRVACAMRQQQRSVMQPERSANSPDPKPPAHWFRASVHSHRRTPAGRPPAPKQPRARRRRIFGPTRSHRARAGILPNEPVIPEQLPAATRPSAAAQRRLDFWADSQLASI